MTDKQVTSMPSIEAKSNYPSLELDESLYQDMMDDPSIPEDQKQELLETLWAIAVACVDMGLGLHPLQQAQKARQAEACQGFKTKCGQFELYSEVPNMIPADMVDCGHTAKSEFDAVNPADQLDSDCEKIGKQRKEEESHDANI